MTADPDPTSQLPRVGPGRGPGLLRLGVVVGVLALGGVGLTALLTSGDRRTSEISTATVPTFPERSEPVPTTELSPASTSTTRPTQATVTGASPASTSTTRPAQATTTAPPPRQRLSSESRLSLDGIGPVDIGMTLEEASAAAGTPIRRRSNDGFGPDCQYAYTAAVPELAFMVINGKIARIDVGDPADGRVKTVSGIGEGSTEDEVKRTYAGRIRVEGHPYTLGGRYLIYVPADPTLAHLSMIFETDGRVVTSFRAGLKGAVSQIEGCS